MNREQIIRMAREAGASQLSNVPGFADFLERFAALVAAAEREELLKHATPAHDVDGHSEIVTVADIRARGQT
jgi:hypothetical protein